MGVEFVGRGCEKRDQHFNREPGVFVVAAGEFFSFRPDWHQDDRVGPLLRQYQLTLDAILRDHPDLASCAVQCCHCGIRFLTHPRNANRRNLYCPFGCREHCRRQLANERSRKHYRTEKGRQNKKLLNGKRSSAGDGTKDNAPPDSLAADPLVHVSSCDASSASVGPRSQPAPPLPHPAQQPRQVDPAESSGGDMKLTLDGFTLDEATLVNSPLLPYLAMVASVIEGCMISPGDLLQVLQRSMRQRSFDRLPRREYVLRFLDQHPP